MTISNASGYTVRVPGYGNLTRAATFQLAAAATTTLLLLGTAMACRQSKAVLSRRKGFFLILLYFVTVGSYSAWYFLLDRRADL